jgi:hypothetical protein
MLMTPQQMLWGNLRNLYDETSDSDARTVTITEIIAKKMDLAYRVEGKPSIYLKFCTQEDLDPKPYLVSLPFFLLFPSLLSLPPSSSVFFFICFSKTEKN